MVETLYENKRYSCVEKENVDYNVIRLNPDDYKKMGMVEDYSWQELFGDVTLEEKM